MNKTLSFLKTMYTAYKIFLLCFSLFISILSNAQNRRDKIIRDSINPIINHENILSRALYNKLKKTVEGFEKEYGYDPGLQKRILDIVYSQKDISFLKKQLSILVKEHGFDVAYMTENELYYQTIMKGELAVWFKKMYIKNHSVWLKNNFDKQIDLRKLNEIRGKDQAIASIAAKLLLSEAKSFDSIQKQKISKEINALYFRNIAEIYTVCKKREAFPNDINFALIQNGIGTALIHNYQENGNIKSTWELLFPFLKKAYLNNEMDFVMFQNYDFYAYLNYGYQEFNSYTIEKIPQQFRKVGDKEIPLKDKEWFENIKKEFNWE